MRELIKKILNEIVTNNKVICDNCGWSWNLNDGGNDPYTCHKCGHENKVAVEKNNFEKVIDNFASTNSDITNEISLKIKKFVYDFLKNRGYNIKFLKACSGYNGVRTKDQIIICSPSSMWSLGDFLYTLFHEVRHEQQVSDLKMQNPLSEMDLDDFEKLYQKYWDMELDADQYAKNMLGKLVSSMNLEKSKISKIFKVSSFIENYPQASDYVKSGIKNIVDSIKLMKSQGQSFEDIQDHPIVKSHISKLENFI